MNDVFISINKQFKLSENRLIETYKLISPLNSKVKIISIQEIRFLFAEPAINISYVNRGICTDVKTLYRNHFVHNKKLS